MNKELKWIIINPTHHNGKQVEKYMLWSNDPFSNASRLLNAKMYHIADENIDETADVYCIINFDIQLIGKEIEFAKKMKSKGAKIVVSFSQDVRFLHGGGLWNNDGFIYTDLCEVSDAILSGINSKMKIYGRFQNKVINCGEYLEDNDFSIPYEERDIDLLTSGAIGEECLGFELEFLSLVKQKFPEKKVVSVIHKGYSGLIDKLIIKYPNIEFADPNIPFLNFLQRTKVYCNPELRPRPGRSLVEAYYCRVPFIASNMMYHSRMCKKFVYNWTSIVDWVNLYETIINCNYKEIILEMEEIAKFDMFDQVINRIYKKFNIY